MNLCVHPPTSAHSFTHSLHTFAGCQPWLQQSTKQSACLHEVQQTQELMLSPSIYPDPTFRISAPLYCLLISYVLLLSAISYIEPFLSQCLPYSNLAFCGTKRMTSPKTEAGHPFQTTSKCQNQSSFYNAHMMMTSFCSDTLRVTPTMTVRALHIPALPLFSVPSKSPLLHHPQHTKCSTSHLPLCTVQA